VLVLRAAAAPSVLLLDSEQLRLGKVRPAFSPLFMIHLWAMVAGYLWGRIARASDEDPGGAFTVEKVAWPPRSAAV
jgi:hypothetical protein